jgi:hypothetical protein
MRARRLPQPAAGPANGGGSEVLSVVPRGGSSEAVESGRSRIDWNNRCALVRVSLLLNIDPVPRLSWHFDEEIYLSSETSYSEGPRPGLRIAVS